MDIFYQKSMLALANYKVFNRNLHLTIDANRKQLDSTKTEVEKLQLLYENLLYEKAHLVREIKQCQDISTNELDKIQEERGHIIGTLEYSEELPQIHQEALTELQEERGERIEQQQVLDGLEQTLRKQNEKLHRKRKFVDEFPGKIASIRATTTGLSNQFTEVLRCDAEEEDDQDGGTGSIDEEGLIVEDGEEPATPAVSKKVEDQMEE